MLLKLLFSHFVKVLNIQVMVVRIAQLPHILKFNHTWLTSEMVKSRKYRLNYLLSAGNHSSSGWFYTILQFYTTILCYITVDLAK